MAKSLKGARDELMGNLFSDSESETAPKEQVGTKPIATDQPQIDESELPQFKKPPQIEPKKERFQMVLEKSTKNRLKKAARAQGVSMNEYILEALKYRLEIEGQ